MNTKSFLLVNKHLLNELVITSENNEIDFLLEETHITVHTNIDELPKYKFYIKDFLIKKCWKESFRIILPVVEDIIRVDIIALSDYDIEKLIVFVDYPESD